jgi:hypothetical protein
MWGIDDFAKYAVKWWRLEADMPHIVLTDEQVQIIEQAHEPVEVRRTDGRVLSLIEPPWTAEQIAEIKKRASSEPCYSGEQVQEHLRLLELEVATTGQCDESRAAELRRRLKPVR